jgi:hypothetical protein
MPKKKRQKLKRRRPITVEQRSDRRTAEFVAKRLEMIIEDLSDLFAEFKSFDHYVEIRDLGWVLRELAEIKDKYESFCDSGVWNKRF